MPGLVTVALHCHSGWPVRSRPRSPKHCSILAPFPGGAELGGGLTPPIMQQHTLHRHPMLHRPITLPALFVPRSLSALPASCLLGRGVEARAAPASDTNQCMTVFRTTAVMPERVVCSRSVAGPAGLGVHACSGERAEQSPPPWLPPRCISGAWASRPAALLSLPVAPRHSHRSWHLRHVILYVLALLDWRIGAATG